MKIRLLEEKLVNELKNTKLKYRKKDYEKIKKEPIIIGITGSRGKSSVCYLLHQYLKNKGYKSVLYSSIEIDSELSYTKKHCAVDNPLKSRETLLNAVCQCIDSNADFLILEVNERAIDLGIINDIDFDIRLITNIIEKQNEVFYPNYVDIKKKFFKGAKEDEKLLLVVKDNHSQELLNELNKEKIKIITSPFLSEHYNIKVKEKDYLIDAVDDLFDSINGVNFSITNNKKTDRISSKLLFPFNVFNLSCVYALLKELNLYDHEAFNKLFNNISIPGRDEIINYENKRIIISVNLVPHLEYLKKYIPNNKLLVVTGATGTGFKGWLNEFNDDQVLKDKELSINFAYKYINKYADEIYITLSDSGSSNKIDLLNYQEKLIDDKIKCYVEPNRKKAIELAIKNAKPNDIVFISGRGNREILCDSEERITLFKDIDIVKLVLRELKGGRK